MWLNLASQDSSCLRAVETSRTRCTLCSFSSFVAGKVSITRSGGKITMTSVPSRSLDFNVKVPPWSSTRPLRLQTETLTFLGVLLCEGSAAERGHDDRDLIFRNPGTAVTHRHY